MLDAWQALISSLLLCIAQSYNCQFRQFFPLSEGRCTLPQSCMLTRVSERIRAYDKHKSPLFPPVPTLAPHQQQSIEDYFKADMKRKKERARLSGTAWPLLFCRIHRTTATFRLIIRAVSLLVLNVAEL